MYTCGYLTLRVLTHRHICIVIVSLQCTCTGCERGRKSGNQESIPAVWLSGTVERVLSPCRSAKNVPICNHVCIRSTIARCVYEYIYEYSMYMVVPQKPCSSASEELVNDTEA